ncbi:hypothetical protein Dda_1350 [Drechslerella dactyloides]|uniref:Uncharacterized protein n=1 Tax=Drechslerella dactyloides TaxID=74499 RepID=A0AAD6NMZ4_DREDA|nr:hypothetical protein Dda_1350 [Drechslerella dactyloides]
MAHQAPIGTHMSTLPASHTEAGAGPAGPAAVAATGTGTGAGTEEDPFDDFDGVHFAKSARSSEVPLVDNSKPSDTGATSPAKEQPMLDADRGDLVYYPAPVPVMLNLPPKLSSARAQSQAQAPPVEAPRTKRESLAPFRRSLGLKASHSKADVSSMFDNILDATVASPVLSVVNQSVSSTRVPGNSGHARSTSKFSMAAPRIEETLSPPQALGQTPATSDAEEGPQLPPLGNFLQATIVGSSTVEGDTTVVGSSSVAEDFTDVQPRISYYPHSAHSGNEETEDKEAETETAEEEGDDTAFIPATLIAELESRKNQQRARTNKIAGTGETRQVPTLLERDALAEVKHQARKRGPVNLAWQADQNTVEEEEDEVPLGLLFANKLSTRPNEVLRTPGLLAMREAEDNEPLRRRQERLKHTVGDIVGAPAPDPADEKETLGQRRSRLQAARQQQQRDIGGDKPADREEPEGAVPVATGINSMSAVLRSNPQKQSYGAPQEGPPRGLLNPELPYGYQAQQQMHVNIMGHGHGPPNRQSLLMQQRKPMLPYGQYEYGGPNRGREHEFGIPFPYAPVNAEYLQHQQALLADQIERWRSSVW